MKYRIEKTVTTRNNGESWDEIKVQVKKNFFSGWEYLCLARVSQYIDGSLIVDDSSLRVNLGKPLHFNDEKFAEKVIDALINASNYPGIKIAVTDCNVYYYYYHSRYYYSPRCLETLEEAWSALQEEEKAHNANKIKSVKTTYRKYP